MSRDHEPDRAGGVLRAVAVAFGFLTRLPVPAVEPRAGDLQRALPIFPVVGLVVGGLAAAVYAGLWWLLPPLPAATVAVAVAVAVTGAFHEDGLADVFDGFFGGYEPTRRLAIMRDSRIGTFGGAALVLSLVLRVGLVASLAPVAAAVALVSGHVLGRGSILLAVRLGRPAEPTSSSAAVAAPAGPVGTTVGAVLALAPVAVLTGAWAVVLVAVATVVTIGAVALARRKVGGLTGDVLGATNQLVHLATMAAVVSLVRWGQL